MLLLLGVGAVLWAKWLMPEEEAVQDRHDEPSAERGQAHDRGDADASGLDDTGLPRRSMLLRSLVLAGGALATVPLVALVGGMIKKPGNQLDHTLFGPTPGASSPNGVPMVYSDGRRVSPDDMQAGGIGHRVPGRSR